MTAVIFKRATLTIINSDGSDGPSYPVRDFVLTMDPALPEPVPVSRSMPMISATVHIERPRK